MWMVGDERSDQLTQLWLCPDRSRTLSASSRVATLDRRAVFKTSVYANKLTSTSRGSDRSAQRIGSQLGQGQADEPVESDLLLDHDAEVFVRELFSAAWSAFAASLDQERRRGVREPTPEDRERRGFASSGQQVSAV